MLHHSKNRISSFTLIAHMQYSDIVSNLLYCRSVRNHGAVWWAPVNSKIAKKN